MTERQLHTVVILGHMNPDGDAAGSVLGLSHYLHCFYPEYQVIPYLAIVCDTATKERIIGLELFEKAEASIVVDHHALNKGYGDKNYLQISESCSENIYHLLDGKRFREAARKPKRCFSLNTSK